jgi:hypothetical protein
VDQYADTKDPFVNLVYKKIRNKNKKLDKINETEKKIKSGEIKPNQEQLEMVNSRPKLLEEKQELEGIISMYREAYPDNPIWQTIGGKKDKKGPKKAA